MSTPSSTNNRPSISTARQAALSLLVILLLAAVYTLVRLPTRGLVLEYYDDGETLYHAMSMLAGRIPYREDQSHHFLGYVLPFTWLASLVGFSAALIKIAAFLHQVATGFGVFLCARIFFPVRLALLSAVLTVVAREPWVVAFHIQYQMNLLVVYTLYLCLRCLGSTPNSKRILLSAFLLSGILFTFDQRTAVVLLLPLASFLFLRKTFDGRFIPFGLTSALVYSVPALLCLLYLWWHHALPDFIEQTFVFPAKYRVGSKGPVQLLVDGISLHKHLFQTPLLTIFGIGGFLGALKLRLRGKYSHTGQLDLLLFTALPLFALAAAGSRDFDYYTIPWLPYLALCTPFVTILFGRLNKKIRIIVEALLWVPVLFPVYSSVNHMNWQHEAGYTDDGVQSVVQYIKEHATAEDTVYVWNYRPDIYVRLGRLSPYPIVNQMLIHPDDQIEGTDARSKHIHPGYQKLFLRLISETPPNYIITYNQDEMSWSPAHEFVMNLLTHTYSLVLESSEKDFRNNQVTLRVYHLRKSDTKG